MDGLRLESTLGAAAGGSGLQDPEDLLVSRFRFDEVPDLVVVSGMRIGAAHRHTGIGLERLPEGSPGAGVLGPPEAAFDVREKKIGQDRHKEMRPRSVGGLVKDRPHSQIALEGAEGPLHLGQGGIEGPDPGRGEFRVGCFNHIGAGECFPDLTQGRLLPGKVDDPGRRKGRAGLFLLSPGDPRGSGRFIDRSDRVVAGHGRIRGLEPAEPLEERLRLRDRSLADGGPKAFQRSQVAGLLEGVHAFLLELPAFREDQGPDEGGILGKTDLLEPDTGVRGPGVRREPFKGLPGRLELLPVFLFRGAAFDKAVGEAAALHQKDVRARGDPAVHDKSGFGDGHPGKGRGKKGVETVEHRDEGLGFGRVPGIDPAGDGTAGPVHHQREADERTVASLLLGVPPPGQVIAPTGSLEIGIAHVVEEHRLGGPGQRLAVLDQLPFDDLFGAPETVGHGVQGILADGLEVAADHLRQARPGGQPPVGREIASGSHEAADDDGTGQAEFPAGEAGRQQDLVHAQLLPGGIGGNLGTGRAAVGEDQAVGGQNGRSPRTGGRRVLFGPAFLLVDLVVPDGRLDDGQKFRIGQARKRRLPGKAGSKQIGQSLSSGRIEREASQMEQDAIAGPLVGLNSLDELVGHIHRAGLFVFDAGFANVHGRSGKGWLTLCRQGEIPEDKYGRRRVVCQVVFLKNSVAFLENQNKLPGLEPTSKGKNAVFSEIRRFFTKLGLAFCGEPVKNEILVLTEHLRHVLHGFDARTHGPIAPGVKKILGDFDMGEGPESLEVFPKKIGPDHR